MPVTIQGGYNDPEFRPNQEQKQATGSSQTWISGSNTPGAARLKMEMSISSVTPQGTEDEVERWTALFRSTDRFYDEFSERFLIVNGWPTLGFDRRKGRTTKHVTADWPLLDPYWHEEDASGNILPGSTRLAP